MIERYEDERMREIWSPGESLWRWMRVEAANYHRIGKPELARALTDIGPPELERVRELERTTRHDVVAFLYALDERVQRCPVEQTCEQLRRWLHFGLTSSDVVDSAQSLALRDANGRLLALTEDLEAAFIARIDGLGKRTTIGRTHGQYAAPMPIDHRWHVLYGMVARARTALRDHPKWEWWGKMSGPVGTNRETEVHYRGLNELGLSAIRSTQILPRDQMIEWAGNVVRLTDACEAIATQVWLLAQEPVGEVQEGRPNRAVGSSAMPHKRNPVVSENIRGLCRLARMNAQVLQSCLTQWGEHDLAHSSVERVALPDLCHLAATILHRTTVLMLNLEIGVTDPRTLEMEVDYTDSHAQLQRLQEDGWSYVTAHQHLLEVAYPGGKIASDNPTREDS
jgi:adenylosuccinate lyase